MRNSCLVLGCSFVLLGAAACSGASTGSGTLDGGEADGSGDDGSTSFDGGGGGEGGGPVDPPIGTGDAGPKKPPVTACQSDQTFDGPAGNCTIQSTYQCETPSGFDAFRVACSCPSATCGCYTNGTLTKTVVFNGCPACTSPVELAKLCGVAGY